MGEDTVRLTEEESHSLTTKSLLTLLVNSVSTALRMSSTRLSPVDHTSGKSTTSSGQSSLTPHSVDSRRRDTLSERATVPGVTEKSSSTKSSQRCCEEFGSSK